MEIMLEWLRVNSANLFYVVGSLCFLIGTLINMCK